MDHRMKECGSTMLAPVEVSPHLLTRPSQPLKFILPTALQRPQLVLYIPLIFLQQWLVIVDTGKMMYFMAPDATRTLMAIHSLVTS